MKPYLTLAAISTVTLSACVEPTPICDREAQVWDKFGTVEDICETPYRAPLSAGPANAFRKTDRNDDDGEVLSDLHGGSDEIIEDGVPEITTQNEEVLPEETTSQNEDVLPEQVTTDITTTNVTEPEEPTQSDPEPTTPTTGSTDVTGSSAEQNDPPQETVTEPPQTGDNTPSEPDPEPEPEPTAPSKPLPPPGG